MNRFAQVILWLCALAVALTAAGCDEGGIGMGVPVSGGGARWGTGAAGPDVFVSGGPAFR